MNAHTGTWSYRAGDWYAVFGARTTLLLPGSERDRVIGLWALIDDGAGFHAVLDGLLAQGLSALPGFVLVGSEEEGTTKVLLRGAGVRAELGNAEETVTLEGAAGATWVERTLAGVTSLSVEVATAEAGAADLPIDQGLVRAAAIAQPPVGSGSGEEVAAAAGAPMVASRDGDGPPDAEETGPIDTGSIDSGLVDSGPTGGYDDPLDDPAPTPDAWPAPSPGDAPADGPEEQPVGPPPPPFLEPWPEPAEGEGVAGPDDGPLADPHEPPAGPPAGGEAETMHVPQPPPPPSFGDLPPPPVPGPWGGGGFPDTPPPPAADEADQPGADHDGFTRSGVEPDGLHHEQPGIPGQPPAPGITRPVAKLLVSNGDVVEVDRVVLIGRAPEARRFSSSEQPLLVTVPSPMHEISSTHVEVRPGTGADHGAAVVTDMGSTNGTLVVQPGLPPEELKPGIAMQLVPGAVINLGDGLTIQVSRP